MESHHDESKMVLRQIPPSSLKSPYFLEHRIFFALLAFVSPLATKYAIATIP